RRAAPAASRPESLATCPRLSPFAVCGFGEAVPPRPGATAFWHATCINETTRQRGGRERARRRIPPSQHGRAKPLLQLSSRRRGQVGAANGAGVRIEHDAWLDPSEPDQVEGAVEEALAAGAERRREGARADLRVSIPSDLSHLDEVNRLFGAWFAGCGFGAQA